MEVSEVSTDSVDKQSAKTAFKDLCIYILFLLVTTIVTLSSRENRMFYFNHTMERLFLHRITINKHSIALTYDEVLTVDDWWSFSETTLIESISYFEVKLSTNMTSLGGNVLLGLPRLRQIRVQNESCGFDDVFLNEFKTCYGDYSKKKEDVGGYLGTKHFTQSEVKTHAVEGLITNYHGAGYIEMLTFDKEQNGEIVKKLKDAMWIDSATRVILVEFTLFNANVKLFCNVKLLAEIPATGGVRTSSHIQSLKYYPLWTEGGLFKPFCAVVFYGMIIYYTVVLVREIISKGCLPILNSVFKIMDIVILLIAYLSIVYIIWHILYLKSILGKYTEDANQYFSLDIICSWNLIFIDIMGICVFIAWIQIFKYIKFNKTMMQFSTTLQRCAKDLLGFSIMFSIVFIAYAYLSILLFGSVHSDFRNFSTAVISLFRTILGDFDYDQLEAANRVMGPIFFLSFILSVFFILMNMFLAIINDTYTDVKSEITEGKDNHFEEYVKSLLAKCKDCMTPPKPRENDEDIENPMEEEPTTADAPSRLIEPTPKQPSAEEEPTTADTPPRLSEPAPSQPSSEEQTEPVEDTRTPTQKLIDSFFEVVLDDKDTEDQVTDEDTLTQRVTALENKFEKLIENLDEVLANVSKNAADRSSRSV